MIEYKQDGIDMHIFERFTVEKKIGAGSYGHVWRVIQKKTKRVYALKKSFQAFQNDTDAQRTFRQISILKNISHPNIVKLHQVIKAKPEEQSLKHRKYSLDLYLVFQYVQKDLFKAICDEKMKQSTKLSIIVQINSALAYLHSIGILHRDLKPSNILLDDKNQVKICDFGLSRTIYKNGNIEEKNIMTEFVATRWYRAPEVLFGGIRYGEKSDMWSFGCLIYEMYGRTPLLPGSDSINQIQKLLEFKGYPNKKEIQSLEVDKLDVLLSHFSIQTMPEKYYFSPDWNPNIVKLMKNLLLYDPNQRWGTNQVHKFPFLSHYHKDIPEITSHNSVISLQIDDNFKFSSEYYRKFIEERFTKKKAANKEKNYLIKSFDDEGSKKIQSLHQPKTNLSLKKPKSHRKTSNSRQSLSLHSHLQSNICQNKSLITVKMPPILKKYHKNVKQEKKIPQNRVKKPETKSQYLEKCSLSRLNRQQTQASNKEEIKYDFRHFQTINDKENRQNGGKIMRNKKKKSMERRESSRQKQTRRSKQQSDENSLKKKITHKADSKSKYRAIGEDSTRCTLKRKNLKKKVLASSTNLMC